MNLLTLSISHRTAPIATVERVALDARAADLVQARLLTDPEISEALVLSTCNRTEVHLISDRFHAGLEAIADALGSQTGLDRADLSEICDVAWDEAAVHHVFSLVSGLESVVVGENQVLGQVRDALRRGQRRHAIGSELNALFQSALRVGKRVQSETAIGNAGRSMFTAALDLAEARGIPLDDRRTLVIGAGQMAGLAARGMAQRGSSPEIVCVNRTRGKAERLADEVNGRAADLVDLPSLLGWADIVITCTGAAHTLIDPALLAGLDHRPDVIIDLAMPADVDPSVGEFVTMINVAELAAAAESDHSHDTEIATARALVAAEVADQVRADRSKAVTPAVIALRAMADQVVEAERDRLVRRTKSAPFTQTQLDEIGQALQRVAEKLVHAPSVEARQLAGADGQTDYAEMLRRLFRLDLEEVAAPSQSSPEHCDTRAALAVASPRPPEASPMNAEVLP